MIVVDSNVIAYLYLPGEYTTRVEALLQDEPDWAAPVLWRSEFRNILAGYMRRGTLTLEQANAVQAAAEDLLQGSEYEVESPGVLEHVQRSDCSAYDCELVSLASKLGVKLVTMDAKLRRAFPKQTVALAAT